jgi:hypothetical protein
MGWTAALAPLLAPVAVPIVPGPSAPGRRRSAGAGAGDGARIGGLQPATRARRSGIEVHGAPPAEPRSAMTRRRKFLFVLLLPVVGLLLGLAGTEVLLRIFDPYEFGEQI